MPAPPATTPLPPPVFMPPTSSAATASPLPKTSKSESQDQSNAPSKKNKQHEFPLPKLRLEIRELDDSGAIDFLAAVHPTTALKTAVQSVLNLLYSSPKDSATNVPATRSVTLIVRPMPGVAYTTGSELDNDHKEIHLSTNYVKQIAKERKEHEIMGVLTHEMVHCYQYNAHGSCPGGLIEGIADWVRLNSNLSPPHWKKETSGNWDAGYQHTGYFLEYLEGRYGAGTIRKLNEKLRTIKKYDQKGFWTELLGRPVEQLWSDYGKATEEMRIKKEEEECVLVEKTELEEGRDGKTYEQQATKTIQEADDDMIETPDSISSDVA